jgi:AraC-like DNA-binding protein
MNPAQKALWYIESHLAAPLTLDDVAGVAGVSRFHLVRAFATATGFSVMRYARARRLTKAAQALAAGAPDILSLALEADYSSHEASPAHSAIISASRPKPFAPQHASTVSSFRSPSSWIQPCWKT